MSQNFFTLHRNPKSQKNTNHHDAIEDTQHPYHNKEATDRLVNIGSRPIFNAYSNGVVGVKRYILSIALPTITTAALFHPQNRHIRLKLWIMSGINHK